MNTKFIIFLFIGINFITIAQENALDTKYRRSSLHTMVIESEFFPQKEMVLNAFINAPFPNKYNDHSITEKSFNLTNYIIDEEEKNALYNDSNSSESGNQTSKADLETLEKELINRYLIKEKIANKLVAKWFDRQEDGSFDWDLVAERGILNASFLETKIAHASADGQAILQTTGFELIANTFVVVNKFNFVSNEILARKIRDDTKKLAYLSPLGANATNSMADLLYESTKDGYSILATSYLYKLVWNDTISNAFFTNLYFEKDAINQEKKEAFNNSDLFKLELIGHESAKSIVTFSLDRTEEQIITLATMRIVDHVFAKLQKKYDVFKTKTPLYTGYPITAKIGTKEGLEGHEKFEVLEHSIDPKTGASVYNPIGIIHVEKHLIWDNSIQHEEVFQQDGSIIDQQNEVIDKAGLDRTTFRGGKKYYAGLLIRQIK